MINVSKLSPTASTKEEMEHKEFMDAIRALATTPRYTLAYSTSTDEPTNTIYEFAKGDLILSERLRRLLPSSKIKEAA